MPNFSDTKLRGLDFGLLLVFQEVFRHRRAAAAATRLGLTQPAISHALKRLRVVTGDTLFVRTPAGMMPTPFALQLAPRIDAILAAAQAAFGEVAGFDPARTTRTFRVSANDFAGSLLAAPLIETLAEEAPQARLSIFFAGGPQQAFAKLRDGSLDVALGRFVDPPADCVATRLFAKSLD